MGMATKMEWMEGERRNEMKGQKRKEREGKKKWQKGKCLWIPSRYVTGNSWFVEDLGFFFCPGSQLCDPKGNRSPDKLIMHN